MPTGCRHQYGRAKHCHSVLNVPAFHSQLSEQTHEEEVEKAHRWGCGRVQIIKCSTNSLMVAKLTVWHKPWEHVRSLWTWSCPPRPHFSVTFPTSPHSSAGAQRDNAAARRWTKFSFLQRTSAFPDLSEDTESSAVFHLSPSGISPLFPLSDSSSVMNFPPSQSRGASPSSSPTGSHLLYCISHSLCSILLP